MRDVELRRYVEKAMMDCINWPKLNPYKVKPWSKDPTFHPTFHSTFRPTFFSMFEVGGQTIKHFTQHFHAQIEKGLGRNLR